MKSYPYCENNGCVRQGRMPRADKETLGNSKESILRQYDHSTFEAKMNDIIHKPHTYAMAKEREPIVGDGLVFLHQLEEKTFTNDLIS